ncbi:SufD family Fe-S cluster assembly protein [Sphingomonas sabuli]|uniref:SufD family Fe-S cluster assembly protein n=1 Tax=Sphingomonas sabuli TaxID=2764186 RepID=A0A7G9KZG7_9SPHN|nr:SufD family Fe-S cluster assembly protein [Sphingomonas sabuli]QNM81766.1 SufD family Fe-S cluster assembly protein [Sphingomonas sabuli]
MTAPFPTRAQEAWRYADLDALQPIWEQLSEPEAIAIAAQQEVQQIWLPSDEAVQVRRAKITLGAGATLRLFALNCAAQFGRIEIEIDAAEGARFELHAANIGSGKSTNEIVTVMRHAEPDGSSRQIIRSVLGNTATGTYMGRIEVARGAQKTDAVQSVKAVLLNRGATANAKPELEIFADDVQCAHGATVGELDAQQLFYLQSRGLPPAEARALLVEGFVMGLFDEADDAIRDAARAALRKVAA